jgi:hypothetical protein
MNMKQWKMMCLMTLAGVTAFAQGGNGAGNGGDPNELTEFTGLNGEPLDSWYAVKADLIRGFENDRYLELDLGKLDKSKFKADVLNALKFIQVEFDQKPIRIGDISRPCENYVDASGKKHIHCNQDAYVSAMKNYSSETQYKMVSHEYFSVADYEPNQYGVSDYPYSSQIAKRLQNVTYKKWAVNAPEVEEEKGVPILRCEGVIQRPDASWTLKRKKEFVITSFADGSTYVTEIIHPLGADTPRIITGGPRGRRTYRSIGIDKITRYFKDYNESSKVRVRKMQRGLDPSKFALNYYQDIEVFGKPLNFVTGDKTLSTGMAILRKWGDTISGIALTCDDLRPVYKPAEVERYQARFEELAKRDWVRLTPAEGDVDNDIWVPMYGMPGAPRETGYAH